MNRGWRICCFSFPVNGLWQTTIGNSWVVRAVESIGVSRAFFFESVLPELRVVRRGRLRLVPVVALEEWLDRNASRVVE